MNNQFVDSLTQSSRLILTSNGGRTSGTTFDAVLDFFAIGGATRNMTTEKRIEIFRKAFEQDKTEAMKCLFYFRDIRGGQGERQIFRDCMKWVAKRFLALRNHERAKFKLLIASIPEFGRWDDIFCLLGTRVEDEVVNIITRQLREDWDNMREGNNVSLLAKWMPSENASSEESKKNARLIAKKMGLSPKEYRVMLSRLRSKLDVLEKKMSSHKWDEIEFDKIPSNAGFKYRNAFATRVETRDRYEDFMDDKNTKVNARTLYPYECVRSAIHSSTNIESLTACKYWGNLTDYLDGQELRALPIIDVSGSMEGLPMEIAISLGLYCAERNSGAFKNLFITFHENPKVEVIDPNDDFVTKVRKILKAPWGGSTNIESVFELIKDIALSSAEALDDLPKHLILVSDMQFNQCLTDHHHFSHSSSLNTDIENLVAFYKEKYNIKMPHIIFWNVNARDVVIPASLGKGAYTCISGFSPSVLSAVMSNKYGRKFMESIIYKERYDVIDMKEV